MNKLKNIIYLLGVSIIVLTGCSDQDDELTSIDYDRVFSPTKLEAKVVERTNVRLTWNNVKDAESYVVEVYDNGDENFEGTTPVKTITDISGSPYTVEGLDGETDYSIRIQAVKSGKNSSKWTSVTAKTDTEQIFENINDDDIEATQVTLHWTAGAEVTHILVTPGDQRYTLSASEIAAGTATISGLTGETAYKATLMNNDKIRGVLDFTTLVDLGGAIAVYPEDDFAALLAEAKDGDTFALFPGTHGDGAKLTVKASIGIKAVKPSDKPVIYGNISIEDGAALHLREIILDGTGAEANQAIIFNTASATYGALLIEGCEIRNHDKGFYYLNVASVVESITIDNCIISNIVCNGGDFMDSRAGAIKTITLSNSTVYNSCAARDFIRYDDKASSFPGITPVINVMNNTLVGVSNDTARRLLYIRFKGNVINFSNNIVANTVGIFSNQKATAVPTFSKNNYYQAPGLFTGGSETALFFDDRATSHNPQFKDAANGDFTVGNDNVDAGDPRWL